ncbi:MAG: cation transporter [Bacteroidetes bacterium]|nr:cation transporter [Bacteroidota bacterium]
MFTLGTKKKIVQVDGMTCHHCEMTVEKALLEVSGVKNAKASHEKKSVEVQYKDALDINEVKRKIEEVGYKFVSTN